MTNGAGKHQEYVDFLELILRNAEQLRDSAKVLLEEKLFTQSCFLMYSSIEECSKFLIVKDLYPQKLTKMLLEKGGFFDHTTKIARLIRNMRIEFGEFDDRDIKKMTKVFRQLRLGMLYVDFTNKPKPPGAGLSGMVLLKLSKLTSSCIKKCRSDLSTFKTTPLVKV